MDDTFFSITTKSGGLVGFDVMLLFVFGSLQAALLAHSVYSCRGGAKSAGIQTMEQKCNLLAEVAEVKC